MIEQKHLDRSEAEDSDRESLAMYRSARNRAEALQRKLTAIVRAGDMLAARTHRHLPSCAEDACTCGAEKMLAVWDAATKGIER